jgi:uncharacterized protein
VLCCELTLPDGATVAEALAVARQRLGPVADWDGAAVGIHGQLCSREQLWADGDRIELYRALQLDPRAARRARAARQTARLKTARDNARRGARRS